MAVWLLILIAYRKRATHQSLARETGNMRHREKLRTVPDVSEQMLELFFAKIRHGELGRKSRRLLLGLTGRATKIPPELGFTRFSLCWSFSLCGLQAGATYLLEGCLSPLLCHGVCSPCWSLAGGLALWDPALGALGFHWEPQSARFCLSVTTRTNI